MISRSRLPGLPVDTGPKRRPLDAARPKGTRGLQLGVRCRQINSARSRPFRGPRRRKLTFTGFFLHGITVQPGRSGLLACRENLRRKMRGRGLPSEIYARYARQCQEFPVELKGPTMNLLLIIIAIVAVVLLLTGGLVQSLHLLLWIGIVLAVIAVVLFIVRSISGRPGV